MTDEPENKPVVGGDKVLEIKNALEVGGLYKFRQEARRKLASHYQHVMGASFLAELTGMDFGADDDGS